MPNIEFNSAELELIRELLHSRMDELDVEISHTDTHEFKKMLKQRKETIARILSKVGELQVPV